MKFLALLALLLATPVSAETIIVQSTTSTQNSGLLDDLRPRIAEATGVTIQVVAVGTGQALKNARNGDGDLLLVHARALEDQFVAEGWGTARYDLMYNDFIIVGTPADPAGVAAQDSAAQALAAIAALPARFVSRGDSSGTHVKELSLWDSIGMDPAAASGTWYLESGSGMGATLNIAVEERAYTLTDRGTWISFGNKKDHQILLEGDPALFNPYGLIAVNPDRHPHVRFEAAMKVIDWLTGPDGQQAIADYKLDGQQLFFPSAQ